MNFEWPKVFKKTIKKVGHRHRYFQIAFESGMNCLWTFGKWLNLNLITL